MQTISFPIDEHIALKKRLFKGKCIFTTRIRAQRGLYKPGQLVRGLGQLLMVGDIWRLADLKQHPFLKYLSKQQKDLLRNQPMDLLQLWPVEQKHTVASRLVQAAKQLLAADAPATEAEVNAILQKYFPNLFVTYMRQGAIFVQNHIQLADCYGNSLSFSFMDNLVYINGGSVHIDHPDTPTASETWDVSAWEEFCQTTLLHYVQKYFQPIHVTLNDTFHKLVPLWQTKLLVLERYITTTQAHIFERLYRSEARHYSGFESKLDNNLNKQALIDFINTRIQKPINENNINTLADLARIIVR